ncbi:MAG: dihydrodipicolinate reductase [Pyrinomonas sp.]|uniref:4-hydroxy-tetrahydrodipicolinate reductase n=1 Tax=Pyrinomonas sp. TaxID=2080306 RepID=UPI0033346B78
MKIALIGYGRMGKLVQARARAQGHETGIVATSHDAELTAAELAARLRGYAVAVDFSVAEAVTRNVEACALARLPLVEGTTGWDAQLDQVRRTVEQHGSALVYGANFSIGANLFFRLVAHAADLFAAFADYAPFIEEAHHARKRDAPSGTALKLRELLARHWPVETISVAATRAGHIPGTHRVGFDALDDQILLQHEARTREGFAAGALLAAEWIAARRRGVYEFSALMDQLISERRR